MSPSQGRSRKNYPEDYGTDHDDEASTDSEDESRGRGRRSTSQRPKSSRRTTISEEKRKPLTHDDYIDYAIDAYKKREEERKQNRWTNRTEFGRRFMKIWKTVWGWWFWKWFLKNLPYLLAFLMIIFGWAIAITGPLLDIWAVELKGVKYGALGGCRSEGLSEQCSTRIFYSAPKVGGWWNKALSFILLSFGIVATLQFLILSYTFLFIRHRIIKKGCCRDKDPESLRSQDSSGLSLRQRKKKSSKWFRVTMSLCSPIYIALSLVLVGWLSEAKADGLFGYELAISLLFISFLWFFIRIFYRSEWLRKATQKVSDGVEKLSHASGDHSASDNDYSDDERAIPIRADYNGGQRGPPNSRRSRRRDE